VTDARAGDVSPDAGTQEVYQIGHDHHHVAGGWLRPAVFGAMDGLVTNIALVAGVGAGAGNRQVIVLSGVAGLVAGAFSMALGEYASVQTQNDSIRAEAQAERDEIERNPVAEEAELVDMYVEMGLSRETAKRVASEVHSDPDLAVKVHVSQELGVDPDEQPSPVMAALSSFLCFAVGALLPLIPYLLGFNSLAAALLVGAVGLFVTGALATRFTTWRWWQGGLRQLCFGALAACATYIVGSFIGVTVS
jgi:VIT1/CCC1 family predicted Fe2+/Mn2+ transporter